MTNYGTSTFWLAQLAEFEGYDNTEDMLETLGYDPSVPSICTNCGEVGDYLEPDASDVYCEGCNQKCVQSMLVLAGVV